MISFRNSLRYPKPTGSFDLPAGNILMKTVNGKTTTYTYDKANQLMTSTKDGKVTTYKYDSAGRMIQEGAKTYRYGYLDKILNVDENGENVASFTYHMDGQIASAKTKSGMESFLWDGLALIGRDKTQYINEPYVTGGNPILSSKDGVMFNDILGNTLGTKSDDKFNPVAMTAFGETADKSAMFTGKPYIGELGYAFLFRNYRAEQGKWQTADPIALLNEKSSRNQHDTNDLATLLGYPNGWNNFAYGNNEVLSGVDVQGTVWVTEKNDPAPQDPPNNRTAVTVPKIGGYVIITTTVVYRWTVSSLKTINTPTVFETQELYNLYSMTYVSEQFYLKDGSPLGDAITNNPPMVKTKQTYTRIFRKVNKE